MQPVLRMERSQGPSLGDDAQLRITRCLDLGYRLAQRSRPVGQTLPYRPHVRLIRYEWRAGPRFAGRVVRLIR